MKARMFKLFQIHQNIDDRIRFELRKPRPDWTALFRLKRVKLKVKDSITRLQRTHAAA